MSLVISAVCGCNSADDENRPQGVSFSDHDVDKSERLAPGQATEIEQVRKPTLMSFPSLEHLDRMADGSPWRNTQRRRRKFRGGIGGLHRRRGEPTADRAGNDDDFEDDEVELDRVEDAEIAAVPDASRKPARTASGVGRRASAAARERKRQQMANRGAAEPENRIYRPVKRPAQAQALPPSAPRPPAPVDRAALRVSEEPSSTAGGETADSASRPRRQRRRRPRGEDETEPPPPPPPQSSAAEPRAAAVATRQPPVHRQPQNGSGYVDHRLDTSTDVATKSEPEVNGGGGRRQTSRRSAADARRPPRTDTRKATFV